MPHIISNHISLYYQIQGTGHPVILISGANGDHQSVWPQSVVDTLARHFQVIQFDNRGVGQSERPDSPYSIEMMADDVFGLVQALQLGKVHLVGYSMGGQIAAKFAEKYPEKINKMIACVSYANINTHVQLFVETLLELPELNLAESIIEKIALPWSFSNQYLEKNFASLTKLNEKTKPNSLLGLRRHFAAQCAFKSEAEGFRNIKAPTLFIAGDEDWICPPADVKKFADLIPNSQMVVFPEAGHLLSLEHPDKFAKVICDFLNETQT
ncbi:MAG: alpha/beta hydrolase [Tatlockia sp.]|nr:alpha/beta hydrolase [Tatlockia sp.]